MPHYANGLPAQHGDLIICHQFNQEVVGVLTAIKPSESSCNGTIYALAKRQKDTPIWFPLASPIDWSVTLKDCQALNTQLQPPPPGEPPTA